ncbi:uncharacterized protein EI90DRAFT_3034018 [Cantharellus anzutake]|uniref:uncharacterized protein n=1 Tax=Cantharellus anzutake TaxID=1750568 RepID=UPI00190642AA|nr:uncharacterized protein EI90DRAFT_3034018 [Cantharellus anzutake]KAF8341458.1 hypothetical protein EI90DRAFT_3034018 [Cantharellus anzutake]
MEREHTSSRPDNNGDDQDADPGGGDSSSTLASPTSPFLLEYGAPFCSEGTSSHVLMIPRPVPLPSATIHSAPPFAAESLNGTAIGIPASSRSNPLFSGQGFRSCTPQSSWERDLVQSARVFDSALLPSAGPSGGPLHHPHASFSFARLAPAAERPTPAIWRLESQPRMEWPEQNPLDQTGNLLDHPQVPFPSDGLIQMTEWPSPERPNVDVSDLEMEQRAENLFQASSSARPIPVAEWPTEILDFDAFEYWREWLEQDPAYLDFNDAFN